MSINFFLVDRRNKGSCERPSLGKADSIVVRTAKPSKNVSTDCEDGWKGGSGGCIFWAECLIIAS
jgi:hypothetical protein